MTSAGALKATIDTNRQVPIYYISSIWSWPVVLSNKNKVHKMSGGGSSIFALISCLLHLLTDLMEQIVTLDGVNVSVVNQLQIHPQTSSHVANL